MDILFSILESFRVSSVGCCIAQGVSRFISVSQLRVVLEPKYLCFGW